MREERKSQGGLTKGDNDYWIGRMTIGWGVHSHTNKAQSLLLQQEEEIQLVSWKVVLKIIGECGCSREQSPGDPSTQLT